MCSWRFRRTDELYPHEHGESGDVVTTPIRFSYDSTNGVELVGYRWEPTSGKPTVGVVVLAHGMGEHIRRYDHVAEALNDRGFAVFGHDHRGHGGSISTDSEPGHLGPNGWRALVDDLSLVIALAKSEYPGKPVILLGHSMGSFAAQQFLLDHAADVDAVALSGSAALDMLESAVDPGGDVDLSAFNAPFLPARTDYDWLSRDPAVVDAYVADPLCGFGIDAESSREMFAGARRAADSAELARIPHGLPVYIAAGSKDSVNADLAFVHVLAERYRAAGLTDVTVRTYEGARHEIFNETNRAEVLNDLLEWLERVVQPPRQA